MKIIKYISRFFYSLFLLLASCCDADAQQSIINVHSSEIRPAGEVILKDSNRFRPFHPKEFISITPSVTTGIGWNTEIAGSVGTSLTDKTTVKGDFSIKKVTFIAGSTRFTVGLRINPYLTETSAPDNFTYAHFSQRIRKTKTSLTAGMYVSGNKQFLPDRPGVVLGIEQVLIPNKLRFATDWISRNETYGFLGTGLKYRPVPTVSITSAALIPNGNKSNFTFLISISKFLSFKK